MPANPKCGKCAGRGIRLVDAGEGRQRQVGCDCLNAPEPHAKPVVPIDVRLAALEARFAQFDATGAWEQKKPEAPKCEACAGAGTILLAGAPYPCPKCSPMVPVV
jgi:hypothetical protein